MDKPVMMTIRVKGSAPSLDQVKARFSLGPSEIDDEFGVVEIEPNVYTVLVEASAASKIQPGAEWETQGPFSNPKIEPFGPPES